MYHFESNSKIDRNPSHSPISIVEVGEWLEGEPRMVRIEGNYKDKLRTILIEHLKEADQKKRHRRWLSSPRRNADSPAHEDYSTLSIDGLIQEVQTILK